eukprot:g2881.t1
MAFSDRLRQAVDDYVAADVVTDELREATLQKVLTALNAKEIELLDIVVHLEKVMCDASNPTGRRHAIQFLAFCLRDIVELKLNFKHVEVFAKFFQNKLSDWQCVEGAVAGILVLFQRQAALIRTLKVDTEEGEGEPMALHLARTMLKEVNVPSHTQSGLTEDKPAEEKKETKKTKADEDDGWHEEEVVQATMKVESAGKLVREEEQDKEQTNPKDERKYPSLAKSVASSAIHLEDKSGQVNIATSKNIFASLENEDDDDEDGPKRPKDIKPALVSKKKGEREKDAIQREVAEVIEVFLLDAPPFPNQESEPSAMQEGKEEEEAEVEGDAEKEAKPKKKEEKKAKSSVLKPSSKAQEENQADLQIQPDHAAVKAKYIGRIKLPRKQLPESELAEKENRPTGKIVGKKKKWADEEEDDKNFEYGVRKSVLDTLLLLSNEWREELTMLGPELGDGISAAIEEERDPRNLLISFTLVKKVLGDFPAACASRETVQSLFETLSSYFPITFQPPKGDKVGITGDDLRQALSQAFCSSQRLAELVIPFLLDASKDIEADVDATVAQAMQTLCFCLQLLGRTEGRFLSRGSCKSKETCRDQVCRTKTTCGAEFCKAVTESLKVSLQGVPAGLHPHWLAKDVVPQLQEMADDASKGRMSLASEGARQLLLSAAAAHPIVYESFNLFERHFQEGEEAFFSIDALEFMVELLQRQQGVFTAKQLQPALKGALETMRTILPQSEEQLHPLVASVDAGSDIFTGPDLRLARLSVASEALQAWQMALLGAAGGPWSSWATAWQEHLSSKPASDPCVTALVQAVCEIMPREIDQAFSLAERLLKVSSTSAEWLPLAMPQLLAHTALSLARAELKGEGRENRQNLGQALLLRASEIFRQHGASGHFEILASLADALDLPTDEGTRWVAAQIATALAPGTSRGTECGKGEGGGWSLVGVRRS